MICNLMNTNQIDRRLLVPVQHNRYYMVQKWLNNKVMNPMIIDKYMPYDTHLLRHNKYDADHFNEYYAPDDQDIQNSDDTYVSILLSMRDISPDSIKEDSQLAYLDAVMESFVNQQCNGWVRRKKNKRIIDAPERHLLIPPNTNRFHVNLLFKRIIDHCAPYNFSIGEEIIPLVDVFMKDEFYKFCYDNSIR